jgi:hypothetical protein
VKAARRGVAVNAQPLGGLPQPHLAGQSVGLLGQLAPLPVGATVLAPLLRSRRAEPVQCQQLKWFAFVIGVCVVSVLVAVAVQGSLPLVATVFWDVALAGVVAGLPAAVDLAILRYRLYDIDRLINRAVVCASLTAVWTWVLLARYWRLGSALSFARSRRRNLGVHRRRRRPCTPTGRPERTRVGAAGGAGGCGHFPACGCRQ